MASTASEKSNTLPDISGYTLVEQLYSGSRTAVYRGTRDTDSEAYQAVEKADSVVIKLLLQEHPSFSDLLQFRNQYAITKNLPIPGIVRPLGIEPWQNGYALVMEDFGGISLQDYLLKDSLSLVEILAIGIQMADILSSLCQHHLVHKDIKPANILIHPVSKQIQLIDFSIASLLPKETQEIQNPNGLEGTLAYLAPEQTGRMNRGIDYRADFYALGVTLYELLAGAVPFTSENPLELVHCHIAKLPKAPHEINPNIPQQVSAIVLKLMAKNAEDRYQNALGLKHDLERCLTLWKETRSIPEFELGGHDLSDRFLIPEKLYGRETEIQILLAAFDRVANGPSEIMLVAGFSGIGKTAVVNEVHKPITRQQGYFVKGKFDQFNRNLPLSAFALALRDLMRQLLSESDRQLADWKTKILNAVGENGQVLIEVIPELERIIGKQLSAPELSGTAAQNRFNSLFQKFIALFAIAERPLVLFLDDLQWADSASLQLIKLLLKDQQHFFLLGAYRDNEVSPTHPFIVTVEELEKAAVAVNTITLAPLALADMNRLVAETLHCSAQRSQPLTELIIGKTQGNPFFSTQFLKALYEDGLIAFNREQQFWECDMAEVRRRSLTNDVVELMAQRLKKLPHSTQTMLKLAACIGNQFDLSTLAIVCEQSESETAAAVWKALQEGLILPQSEVYKFHLLEKVEEAKSATDSSIVTSGHPVSYRFLHDRVQQAAYFLIPDSQKQATHLKIGQLLLVEGSPTQRDEKLFEIVNHLNVGKDLVTLPSEQNELIELNLAAGRKAKSSAAYQAAIDYFTIAIEQLEQLAPDCWQSQYALTLALHEEMAEATYLNGDFDSLNDVIQVTLGSAKALLDKVATYEIQIQACLAQNLLREAIEIARDVLKQLGIRLPKSPNIVQVLSGLAKTKLVLAGKKTQDLVNLPAMTHPEKLAAMRILSSAVSAAFIGAPKLLPLLVFQQVNLSVKYGNMPLSAFAYAWYGTILCGVLIDVDGGYAFGDLALQVLERFQARSFYCKTTFMVNSFIDPWKQPLKLTVPKLQAAYQSGIETGDQEYAAWAALLQGIHLYWMGHELIDLEKNLHRYGVAVSQSKQNNASVYINIYRQSVLNLMGEAENPSVLAGPHYSETQNLQTQIAAGDRTGLFFSYVNQLQLRYLFGEISDAVEAAQNTRQYEEAGLALFPNVPFYLYESLTYLAVASTASKVKRSRWLKRVVKNQRKLKKWANFSPENAFHKWHLVEAEQYRVKGQHDKAMAAYDLAIAGAKSDGYSMDEALANELAAKGYIGWGNEKLAMRYMQEAYYCYARWGAKAKTDRLEDDYPGFLSPILKQSSPALNSLDTSKTIIAPTCSKPSTRTETRSASTRINTALDLTAVLEASQALSSTMQLDELMHQLTQSILQNSGGDRCALILPNQAGEWCVEAIATPTASRLCSAPVENNTDLPVKLIQYVKNTQAVVVIDHLKTDLPVIDSYLVQKQPQSVLCMPIVNQSHLIGILCLTNQSASGVFTTDRVLILNLLCTQAAISLENARLYQQAQAYSQQLEQSQLQTVQSEKMASLGNLVAGVAHEINNPIGFLNGSIRNAEDYVQDLISQLELYQQHYPSPIEEIEENAENIDLAFTCADLPKLLASMKGATDRIKAISTSLRTFSRADTEHKVSANIHEGLDSTLLILKYRLKADEHRLAIEVVKDYGPLPAIDCFPGRLNQVFMNLLANAIDVFDEAAQHTSLDELKATPQIITLKTEVFSEQNLVSIRIGDNGKGMPEEIKAKVFDHLFTTKKVGKGTGLGLAIARQIITEAHGGTLAVSSELGQGTEFLIQLPISD